MDSSADFKWSLLGLVGRISTAKRNPGGTPTAGRGRSAKGVSGQLTRDRGGQFRGHQWAETMAISGQFRGRLRAVFWPPTRRISASAVGKIPATSVRHLISLLIRSIESMNACLRKVTVARALPDRAVHSEVLYLAVGDLQEYHVAEGRDQRFGWGQSVARVHDLLRGTDPEQDRRGHTGAPRQSLLRGAAPPAAVSDLPVGSPPGRSSDRDRRRFPGHRCQGRCFGTRRRRWRCLRVARGSR